MGVLLGVAVYVVVLAGFILFGKFLKDCDETMVDIINH